MNILITGSNGQLGNELKILIHDAPGTMHHYFFTDIDELDITNYSLLEQYLLENNINIIINCAAYTAVDKAESEVEKAFLINKTAVSYLAQLSLAHNIYLIHTSTDYVFDGMNYRPYLETDLTSPQSVYGNSKLQGENEVFSKCKNASIIRTSWLYSGFGQNFVKTVIRLANTKNEVNIVFDQVGSPTYAKDLASAILTIIPQAITMNGVHIYHYSNEGVCSWYDFAKAIIEISSSLCHSERSEESNSQFIIHNSQLLINPIESKQYPTPAKRPFYSVLNKNKIKTTFNISIPYWRDSLTDLIMNYKL